jgi:hypothetical protein
MKRWNGLLIMHYYNEYNALHEEVIAFIHVRRRRMSHANITHNTEAAALVIMSAEFAVRSKVSERASKAL